MPAANRIALVESLLRIIAASFGDFGPQFKLILKWGSANHQQWASTTINAF
jgi:hypothetical protein